MLFTFRKKRPAPAVEAAHPAPLQPAAQDMFHTAPSIPDLIAPSGIRLERDYAIVDSRYVRTIILRTFPRMIGIGWLSSIFEYLGDLDVAVHVFPSDDQDVVKKITEQMTNIEAQLISDRQKGKLQDDYSVTALSDLQNLRHDIQYGLERLFYLSIYINVGGQSLEELNLNTRAIELELHKRGLHTRRAIFGQVGPALKSVIPSGEDHLGFWRLMSTSALGTVFPFTVGELNHPRGIFLGFNLKTGTPVFLDTYDRTQGMTNYNGCIIAPPGWGKSYTAKLLMGRSVVEGVRHVIIDPEGEYRDFTRFLGGVIVKLSVDSVEKVNFLDLEEEVDDHGKTTVNILEKVIQAKETIRVMAGGRLSPEESALVEQSLLQCYADRGITTDPQSLYEKREGMDQQRGTYSTRMQRKVMPRLSDLYELLKTNLQEFEGRGSDSPARLLTVLKPFLEGGTLGVFDCHSTVDLKDAPVVTFDVSSLEENLMRPIAMNIVLTWIWSKFVKKDRRVRKRIITDETWRLMRHEDTATFLEQLSRQIRKYNGGLWVVSQNLAEFMESRAGKIMLSSSRTVILLHQSETDIDFAQQTWKFADGVKNFLLTCDQGEAWVKAGDVQVAVKIHAFAEEDRLINTTPAESGGAAHELAG